MEIDWEAIARKVGGIDPDGRETVAGTPGGRRALEILLGEENLRDAVDFWISQKPGYFTAEMVLKIIRPTVAMERCYEIFKNEPGTERAAAALFLLAHFADLEALPWVHEFLDDSHPVIRWNGLSVLQYILYGPVGDSAIATANELLDKAESGPDPELRDRAKQVRLRLAPYEPRE